MAKVWTCSCGAMNEGRRPCESCSRPYQGFSGPARRQIDTTPTWDRDCQWSAKAGRCRMRATIQESGGKQFCQWHYCCSHEPRLADDYEAFEEFCLDLLIRNHCTVWTHYRVSFLWAAITGTEPPISEPTACGQRGCRFAVVEVPDDFEPRAAGEQVRRLLVKAGLAESRRRKEPEVDDDF